MEVKHKQHRFGERTTVNLEDGQIVEFMVFTEEGSPHQHSVVEVAHCVKGKGWIWINREKHEAGPGMTFEVPVGETHLMQPDPESEDPFAWVISYKEN